MRTRASVDVETVTRLRTVVCRLSRRLNSSTPNVGLTPSQVSVLASVGMNGPLGVTELAGLAGLNPTMVSRIVGKLVAAGLIDRAPDPDDRRAALISVTPAGRRLLVRIHTERRRGLDDGLAAMTEAEVAALLDALPALESLARRFGINLPAATAPDAGRAG